MDFTSIFLESEPIAGIEVSDSVIRLVLAKRNKLSKTEIAATIEQPLESGVVFGGEILKEAEFIAALKKLRARCPKDVSCAVLAVSPQHTYGKVFTFPNSLHGRKLEETVRLTIDYQLPLPSKDSYSDFQVISERENIKVLIVSASKDRIDRYISAFAAANFPLVAVERYQMALMRAMGESIDPEEQGLIVKMPQPDGMQLFVYIGAVCYFTRFLPTGHDSAEAIENQIKNLLDYLDVEYGIKPKILEYAQLQPQPDLDFAGAAANKNAWMLGIGAALRGLIPRSKDHMVSLMPVSTGQAYEFRKAIGFSRQVSAIFITASIFFVVAFAGAWTFMASLQHQTAGHIQTLDTPPTPTDAAAQAKIERVNALVDVSANILHGRPEWSRVLSEIQARLTPGIIITNVEFPGVGQPMSITGVAQTRPLLNSFRASLEKSVMLTSIQLPLTNLDQLANIPFSITFSLKDPNSIYSQ